MAVDTIISNAAALAACNAIVDLLDAGTPPGKIKIYSGTVPADVDTAITDQTLLATLNLSNTAFGAAADDTGSAKATAASVTSAAAGASGTASFFRATNAAGTAVIQGTVGTTAADLILDSVVISSGATVAVSAWTFSVPEQA
jgi:hypothetical protein